MTSPPDRLQASLAGRYRIERELGAGGMATVYLAHDLKHDRKVAIKVLKPELAAVLGAERFVQEIKTTASLSHPHILPLFDSGTADGFLFYVMPFIQGETIREKLTRERQFAVDEAVRVAREVADALDYAHRHGVIHRDVKPENILLHDGRAMVMDFGIALAVSAAAGGRMTETGLSLGTPHYMSPEQATAEKEITPRSDIYSLASVLYEMLAGQPPHGGGTGQQVIMKILTEQAPSVREFRKNVPANVDAALAKALEKVAADRFEGARAFSEALGNAAFAPLAGPRGPRARSASAARYAWPAAAIASALMAWLGWHRASPGQPVERLHLVLPPGQQLQVWPSRSDPIDISPDGRRVAYQNQVGGTSQLVVRELDSFETRTLDGTLSARHHFFSPDGEWLAFFADGALQRVPVHGGSPLGIAKASGPSFGGSWGTDGRILYADSGSLYLVNADGATPARRIALPDSVAFGARGFQPITLPRWPQLLPDGKRALVTITGGTIVVDLTTSSVRYLFPGEQAQYLPTGHLVYSDGAEHVRGVPFDIGKMALSGAEFPVLDNVFRGPGSGATNFAVASRAGTLVYAQGSVDRELVLVDRAGRVEALPAEHRGYRFPKVSPDGRHVAVTVDPRPSDLWIVDLVRGTAERQQTPAHDGWGVWSPDGTRLAFVWGDKAPMGWRRYPLASDPIPIMRKGTEATYPSAWAPDDRLLTNNDRDILAVSVKDGTVDTLLATSATEVSPALTTSGRWMAYVSDVSGANEVYVQGYPVAGERRVISVGGGVDPVWSRDGSELYYRSGNTIFAVPTNTGERFAVRGPPVALFSGPYDFTQLRNWSVTPDGHFLMIRTNAPTTTQLFVVVNWFDELKRSISR